MYRKAASNAKARSIPFDLAPDTFADMLAGSAGVCALTRIPFDFARHAKGTRRPFLPSLDRIDSAVGYSPANCRIVCTAINYAMSDWGMEPVLRIARALVAAHAPEAEPDLPLSVGRYGYKVRVYRRPRSAAVQLEYRVEGEHIRKSAGVECAHKAIRIAERLSERLEADARERWRLAAHEAGNTHEPSSGAA